ncbi:translation initiation factor IF-3 [Arthrobacter zhaoguopingii]|uniref:translation initiation factor IF-3 n=1 Tax=Arthrobacter zhaoguopingii TaxID=2681491 RepID=UPI001FEB5778
MRLVGPAGEQVGIVRIEDALRLAAESDLDLVEVAPQAKPPVAKLMDFGKYKYEAAVKAREARKNQTNTVLKEIRFRLKIDTHDYETKRGHAIRFLGAGDKVKAMIQFRGREQQRPEMGIRLLQRFAEDVAEVGVVESSPRIDGRNMVMVIGPVKNKAEAKAEARRATQRADAKAANEAAKSGTPRVDVSGTSGAPLTQTLADLLPEGYSITGSQPEEATAPAETAPEAPEQAAPAQEAAPAVVEQAAPAAEQAPAAAEQAAPAAEPAKAPAPRQTPARTTRPAAAASKPAAARPAAAASKPAEAKPAAEAAPAAPAPAPKPMAAPKPGGAPKPMAVPKPAAAPKPAGRTAPSKSPSSRPKPGSSE